MKIINLIVLVVCLFSIPSVSGQSQADQSIEKNSISANILGTGSYLGISYERLIADRVSAEIGIGLIGIGVGATIYPLKKVEAKQLNPFVGIKFTNHAIVDGENKSATYLPIGLTYFSKNDLNFSIDIGPSYFNHKSPGYMPTQEELDKYPFSDFGFWGNLKIGLRF
ncbi:MAG: hypothetical protein AB8B74_06305 [Crocinitomicaceae bacterium]